jgi:hypothetical protein
MFLPRFEREYLRGVLDIDSPPGKCAGPPKDSLFGCRTESAGFSSAMVCFPLNYFLTLSSDAP